MQNSYHDILCDCMSHISYSHTFLQWGFAPLADIIQDLIMNINNNSVQALYTTNINNNSVQALYTTNINNNNKWGNKQQLQAEKYDSVTISDWGPMILIRMKTKNLGPTPIPRRRKKNPCTVVLRYKTQH